MKRAATLGLALLVASAAAHGLTLVSRDTRMSGQFSIGFATVADSGNLSLNDTALSSSFAEILQDSGALNTLFGNTPVEATAAFMSAQAFDVSPSLIAIIGETSGSVTTPYSYVSTGVRSSNSLRLVFSVDSATPFGMSGSIVTGGGIAPASVQLRPVSAAGGQAWTFSSSGAFDVSGTLMPGTWEVYAFSSTRNNQSTQFLLSGYQMDLVLGAVPEPAAWLMLSLGLGGLLWRRRVVGRAS